MKTSQRVSDLRVMTADQLQDEILRLKKEQFNLRFQRATGQLENTSRIDRIATLVKEIGDAPAQLELAEGAVPMEELRFEHDRLAVQNATSTFSSPWK